MAVPLREYEAVVGREVLDELQVLANHVRGRLLQHINSTAVGGGVAEILTRMVPLLQELGVDTRWDVITGDQEFFAVTKAFHNALHGTRESITAAMFDHYLATIEDNLRRLALTGDIIWVHDPQPAGLVQRRAEIGGKWVWRCHIDVSAPVSGVWEFLSPFVEQFDATVFSMPAFARQLDVPQYMVAPSIDPLSDKNRELAPAEVERVVAGYGIDAHRPIMTQISRFDRLKDPLGVIAAYRIVRRRHDCQLVLAGGGATDDPEGQVVLAEVQAAAAGDPDIHVLLLPAFSDLQINALVRASTVVLQKSIKEGFGLTVTEAMWKKKPVIGGAVGGIKQQVIDGVTGFLVHSPEGAAHRAIQLLVDAELRGRLGENGYLHAKQNFLITRQVKDYLLLMAALDHLDEHLVYL
ncbi:MAG: glycosyltransferase [Vicinamibacterales bacterium]